MLRTIGLRVGDSSPIALWASAMACSRLSMLPGFRCSAHSAMYDATVSGNGGSGFSPCASHHAQKCLPVALVPP